ncbi:MAG: acetate kinase [Anaerolineae bacterium]|nr:acetate kinase [Anaerolineae bacterium]
MKILVINSGSSSIKYQCFDMATPTVLATGLVERIGEPAGRLIHRPAGGPAVQRDGVIPTHRDGLAQVVELLLDGNHGVIESPDEITAVGHRVVHGGERFSAPTVIDDDVRQTIRDLSPLAPLHNPPNLVGIEVATELFPDAVQVAVFDTAFHQTMPPEAYRYAIPTALYDEHKIRAYGFHGTSHQYVSDVAARHLGKPATDTNLITIHLGNGCSITAVRGGQSVDTSMGFSPLPGLIMGTRSGDIDPAVVFFLSEQLGMPVSQIDRVLNKQSGLLGLAGANDLRDIQRRHEEGDEAATLALTMYTYRIKKYIGAYFAALGRVDALVFTAGVGQNSALVRQMACDGLGALGVRLDDAKNAAAAGDISEIQAVDSPVCVLVIATNEELEIARQTVSVIRS